MPVFCRRRHGQCARVLVGQLLVTHPTQKLDARIVGRERAKRRFDWTGARNAQRNIGRHVVHRPDQKVDSLRAVEATGSKQVDEGSSMQTLETSRQRQRTHGDAGRKVIPSQSHGFRDREMRSDVVRVESVAIEPMNQPSDDRAGKGQRRVVRAQAVGDGARSIQHQTPAATRARTRLVEELDQISHQSVRQIGLERQPHGVVRVVQPAQGVL